MPRDGLNLVCEIRGKGDKALLFLHGWCGDREYWKHQVDVFSDDAVIIEGVGHYPMLEKSVGFNQKLGDVLKEFAGKQ